MLQRSLKALDEDVDPPASPPIRGDADPGVGKAPYETVLDHMRTKITT